jgi:hypothetical protein
MGVIARVAASCQFYYMETPIIPDAETTLQAINPLRQVLWEALEHGIGVAKLHFGPDKFVGASLGSHIARYHAKQFLMSRGTTCEHVALDGIAFRWHGYYIRVLKSDDGALPIPGASERKQNFYCQKQLLLFQLADGEAELDPEINLVVLWDVNRGSFTGLKLTVVCPKAGRETRESVEAYWERELLHPAAAAQVETADDAPDDLIITDLPNQDTGSDDGSK